VSARLGREHRQHVAVIQGRVRGRAIASELGVIAILGVDSSVSWRAAASGPGPWNWASMSRSPRIVSPPSASPVDARSALAAVKKPSLIRLSPPGDAL